jgi:hypothetical protein
LPPAQRHTNLRALREQFSRGSSSLRVSATAEEVAHRLGAGDVEVPLVPPDEIIVIMETVDTVLAQARGDA